MAPAGNDDALVGGLKAAQLTHDRGDIAFGSDEKHFIIGFYDRITLGHDGPIAAEDRRHPGVDPRDMLSKRGESLTDQGAIFVSSHCHELGSSLSEVQHLERPGKLNKPFDVLCHHLFGVNEDIDRHMFARKQAPRL